MTNQGGGAETDMQRGKLQLHGELDVHAPGEQPLESLISNWLGSGAVDRSLKGAARRSTLPQLPFPIRLTLDQLRDLADETELRAQILAWMIGSSGFTEPTARKVQSLNQISIDLRRMAERLLEEVREAPAS